MIKTVLVEDDLFQLGTTRRGWPSSCNVYLVRDGDQTVMIDTGLGVEPDLGALCAAATVILAGWGQSLTDIRTIILTHTHTDHAGGAVPLARRCGARVLLPARGWTQAADAEWQVHHILPAEVQREIHPRFDVAQHFRAETMPVLFSEASDVRFELIEHGEERRVGRYRLHAHHLPGHDVAHLAWVDPDYGVAFTGDMMMARGTSLPWYPPNAGGVEGYLDSLRRFQALRLRVACPGHHDVLRGEELISSQVAATIDAVHRRNRRIIEQLLEAPAAFATLDDLVYSAEVRAVIPWASSVTMAHLQHLEAAGLVRRSSGSAYLTEPLAAARYLDAPKG